MNDRYDPVVLSVGMAGLVAANRCAREGRSSKDCSCICRARGSPASTGPV